MVERMLRRGLPRVKGGEPWPPATAIASHVFDAAEPAASAAPSTPAASSSAPDLAESTESPREEAVQSTASGALAAQPDAAPAPAAAVALRRGLPRTPGGEPWPPASSSSAHAASAPAASAAPAASPSAPDLAESTESPLDEAVQSTASGAVDAPAAAPAIAGEGAPLRRGLPRTPGGEPWPPAGAARVAVRATDAAVPQAVAESTPTGAEAALVETALAAEVARVDISTPLPFTRSVWQGKSPRHGAPEPEPSKFRPTWPQAIGGLLAAAGLGLIAVAGVFFVRMLLSTPFMQDFLTTYPGEYHPTVDVAPGFSPWIGWQHFFNIFLMVLIIRSGLRVRSESRPTAFWTGRGKNSAKVSLTVWFHQALDVLWLVNGVIFVVLLVVTGHWVRIVPTSWEVFPNALSAGLQYISFDWPTDNGWVNYNSLQQLAYFTTVFIAAPLAIITGVRMSGLWPKKAEKLSKAYPVEWARALHFPIMLYFVAFIIVHVALVFLTGALRNLNHMFASLGSVDGVQYAANWTGFWVFVLSMAVVVAGWYAARPLVIAPIAKLFGQVSGR
ncbi:hypothetical protein FM104_10965 [Microbacterium esteraromaticum]|uniref:Cytochrome b561 bacterial/Ni-hydrogenase domain-containing protein n=1 Tax=Microbacterium esteraromaticum TaxID=57043 RepID=A0A1R4K804_9MICO|nr:cytochrome b/b6 domain-containing protein [Microbacterium esteraromaticum]SJN40378.1 hypothetical protein FM104_10965 [Microbacterium esteraromaticum]